MERKSNDAYLRGFKILFAHYIKKLTLVMNFFLSFSYNNQWMVVDYKRFKPGQPLQDGLLWVLEQLP